MPVFDAPRSDDGADDGFAIEPVGRSLARSPRPSTAESQPPQWQVLERGGRRLALFRGWPEPGLVLTFRRMSMTIGLALEGRDLAGPGSFDGCDYVLIGGTHQRRSVFDDALRDLSQAGWTIDRDAAWPVIVGGYRPRAPEARPLPAPSEEPILPIAKKPERMEA